MKSRIRIALLVLIALLYAVSIPWYRAADEPLRMVFGLPDWVAVALGSYVAVAFLNAAAWLLSDIPESEADFDEHSSEQAPPTEGDSP